jgi:hypothetical protein
MLARAWHNVQVQWNVPSRNELAYVQHHFAQEENDMNFLRTLLLGLSLVMAGAAWSAEPVVVLQGNSSQNPTAPSNSVDIQQNTGSRCEARAVGNCGSCAVSCPVGQSATCKPGRAVGKDADASCTTDPSCTCK